MKLHCRTVANLPQSHAVPDAEGEPNVAVEYPHCCCHHGKPRDRVHLQQQPTRVCQKRDHLVIEFPAFVSPDQNNQQEVCSVILP